MTSPNFAPAINASAAKHAVVDVDRFAPYTPASFDVDMLDPESMLAFFSHQMSDVRTKLGTAMRDQETRNRRVERLEGFQARLTAFQESGVHPGHAQWADFKALADQMLQEFPSGHVHDVIKQAFVVMPPKFTNETCANIARARGAHVTPTESNDPEQAFHVVNEYVGLDKNAVQSLAGELKSASSAIQSDNAMNMINIQRLVEQSSQITQMCSNIMKKLSDMTQTPINNIK